VSSPTDCHTAIPRYFAIMRLGEGSEGWHQIRRRSWHGSWHKTDAFTLRRARLVSCSPRRLACLPACQPPQGLGPECSRRSQEIICARWSTGNHQRSSPEPRVSRHPAFGRSEKTGWPVGGLLVRRDATSASGGQWWSSQNTAHTHRCYDTSGRQRVLTHICSFSLSFLIVVFSNVAHFTIGAYVFEFMGSLEFEWQVLTGKRPFKPPMLVRPLSSRKLENYLPPPTSPSPPLGLSFCPPGRR